MQSNKFRRFRSFVKEKGYYIVLLLCAVAVGVSGYFLLRGRIQPIDATDGSVPSVSTPSVTKPNGGSPVNGGEQTLTDPQDKVPVLPVRGDVIYDYAADVLSYNETTRDWRTHEGVDFRAKEGEEVVAVLGGTVFAIYDDSSLGTTVVLKHDDGYTTHYANLAREVRVKVGDRLNAGAVLGTIGSTAGIETAMEPHLHFAVYRNNRPVDPIQFLKTGE